MPTTRTDKAGAKTRAKAKTQAAPRSQAKAKASPKADKLARRLAQVIARLYQGERIDKHDLAVEFGVDVRTIERDLSQRLAGIAQCDPDGAWCIVPTVRAHIPTRLLGEYAELTGTQNLFPDKSLKFKLEQLDISADQRALHVLPVASEDLRARSPEFARLGSAIHERHECRFHYKGKARRVQPYKLLTMNGVWYLAADEGGRLKNFSVALIADLDVDEASRFTPNPAHQDYIKTKDDVWFGTETTDVLLRVRPEVAHYFKRRALLPQQQQRADPDGSLVVSTRISHPQQLLPVVRFWLPHVRIIQPQAWQTELETQLCGYLGLHKD